MEATNEVVVPEHYSPNQLVTYKRIDPETKQPVYVTEKVTQIEWDLEQMRHNTRVLSELRTQINGIENSLADWIESDNSAAEIVEMICDQFGFNPTKEIEFEATATITGTVSIPLKDMADFDIDSLDLFVNVDSYSYEINADAEVDNITTL